jgi:hypothetical protein
LSEEFRHAEIHQRKRLVTNEQGIGWIVCDELLERPERLLEPLGRRRWIVLQFRLPTLGSEAEREVPLPGRNGRKGGHKRTYQRRRSFERLGCAGISGDHQSLSQLLGGDPLQAQSVGV